MAKCKIKPDSGTFHFVNANPFQKKTGDCVIRAISLFLGKTWREVYLELASQGIENGLSLNSDENFIKYLQNNGFEKQRMPRRSDNTRYTAEEFCKELSQKDCLYILSLANHLTFVGPDQRIWDTWDCGYKSVGNYWVKSHNKT